MYVCGQCLNRQRGHAPFVVELADDGKVQRRLDLRQAVSKRCVTLCYWCAETMLHDRWHVLKVMSRPPQGSRGWHPLTEGRIMAERRGRGADAIHG